ncbi:MAG: hypothetical protein M1365_06470 [Actinobacteria bacterium]|nr:hypothetical protein [Actinomycetota bacterium]
MKGIIYYTDNQLNRLNHERMLSDLVMQSLIDSGLPIVSCSLKPMKFGKNIVLNLKPGVISMYKQMLTALKTSNEKYVFFCEHDVLYHSSHFEFTPSRDDTFYYNTNVYRCHIRRNLCVTYNKLRSVSGICVNRKLAVRHYIKRLKFIYDEGFDKLPNSRNPKWSITMGFEPGKNARSGGFNEEKIEDWRSDFPNIDVRHRLVMTPSKMSVAEFGYTPDGWIEKTLEDVPGWNLKKLFNI